MKLRTSDAKDPTAGTRLTFFAIIPREVTIIDRPMVAPNAQNIPPIKLLKMISFIGSLVALSYG